VVSRLTSDIPLNISKAQQRTLHALAQGGTIVLERDERGDLLVFKALRRNGLIVSRGGGPYRINREGLANLRSQLDNRTSSRLW